MRGPRRVAVLVPALLVVLLSGCGTTPTPDAVTPLSVRLAQIDESLAANRFEEARRDLTALAAQTKAARDGGEISASRADAILDAIVALRSALPAPPSTPAATPTPTPTPTTPATTPTAPRADDEPAGKGKGGGKGKKP